MKTFITDIIPKIHNFSQKLDNLTLLTNQHWVAINDLDNTKNVYIFRSNNELLISQNGKVDKGRWEYLGNNSLLIDHKEDCYLFKQGFFDENILALKIDSKDEYAFFVNETKFGKELNSSQGVIEFLNRNYFNSSIKDSIHNSSGHYLQDNAARKELKEYYTAPKYVLTKILDRDPLFGTPTELYSVEYEDGKYGEVMLIIKNKHAYFSGKKWHSFGAEHHYANLDSCINALHYYLKTKKFLSEGFIATYK